MVEPITIVTLVGIIATFLLNLYQSVKSRHFEVHSDCTKKTVDISYESQHQTKNDDGKN